MNRKKILLLGNFNVGKTSLITQYIDQTFTQKNLRTIGVKITKKQFKTEHETYELLLWDLEGNTPQDTTVQTYYSGADGAIFVADATRHNTIRDLEAQITLFKSINPDTPYLIAYNKIDLLDEEQQRSFNLNRYTFLTSAKENIEVEEIFTQLAKLVFHREDLKS